MNALLLSLALLLLSLLLWTELKGRSRLGFLFKGSLSGLFLLYALLQPWPEPSYAAWLLWGLSLCLLGDLFLAFTGWPRAFLLGLIAFLLGHLCYLVAFLSLGDWGGGLFWLGLLATTVASGGALLWLWPHLGRMRGPVLAYLLMITLMLWGAWLLLSDPQLPAWARALSFGGALSFYLSDLFVARQRFIQRASLNRLLGLPLYYLGQFALAGSLALF